MAPPRGLRALQGLLQKELIGAFGLGLLLPAFFTLASVRLGGFAVPAALALAAFGFPARAGALGALAGAALLPLAGVTATLALGAVLAGMGWTRDERPVDWSVVPAAAAWVCWARIVSLLLGDPLWAVGLLAAAAAAGRWTSPAAAGALGAAGLAFARLIGLNAGAAERLQLPAAGTSDLLFLGLQPAAAAAAWLAFSGAAGRRGPAVAAGAALGAGACWLVGPEPAALGFHAAQALLGARAAAGALPASLLAMLLAFLLAWPARRLLHDVWLTRLNAAYPGGKWLTLRDTGAEALGAYRFVTGAVVAVEDGVARELPPQSGRRAMHLLALSHKEPKTALVISRSAGAVEAARHYAGSIDLVDPHPDAEKARGALGLAELPATARAVRADPRRFVRKCAQRYDVALVSLTPLQRLRRLATRGFMRELKACLNEGGVAAFVVPSALEPDLAPAVFAAASDVFVNKTAIEQPGMLVLLFSDAAAAPDLTRLTESARIDDPRLEVELGPIQAPPEPAAAPTDDKPYGPSVTTRNWYNPRR